MGEPLHDGNSGNFPLLLKGTRHRRRGLEELQNSLLSRQGWFPFPAGSFGCFPATKT